MLPPDVEFYIAELGRVLAPGGTGLVTAFLRTSVERQGKSGSDTRVICFGTRKWERRSRP